MDEDFRSQVFNELNLRDTEDLIEIWQNNDREEWSDTAFEVIREILWRRLGELPEQNAPGSQPDQADQEEDISDDGEEILELEHQGDIDGLKAILAQETDAQQCLWAARALARLGDEAGLDYLIDALDIPDAEVNSLAMDFLVALHHPRGDEAVKAHLEDPGFSGLNPPRSTPWS